MLEIRTAERRWVEGGYRDSFGDSSDAVRVGIAGNPAQVLERDIEDPFGGSIIASAGLEADVGPGTMSIGYRGRGALGWRAFFAPAGFC